MIKRAAFQQFISILVTVSLLGCTSMQPIEAQPETLHQQIRHEDLIQVGDKIGIFTQDEKEHRFIVTGIDSDAIYGADVTIPIDSVVAVQTREVSIGKTGLLTGGVLGVWLLIRIAIAPALILAASAP